MTLHNSSIWLNNSIVIFLKNEALTSKPSWLGISSGHSWQNFILEGRKDTEYLFRYSTNLFQILLILKWVSQLENVITVA